MSKKNIALFVVLTVLAVFMTPFARALGVDMRIETDDGLDIEIFTPTAVQFSGLNIALSTNNILTEFTVTPDTNAGGFTYKGYNGACAYSASGRLMLYTYSDGTIGYSVAFPFDVWDKNTKQYYAAGTSIRWTDITKARTFYASTTMTDQMAKNREATAIVVTTARNLIGKYSSLAASNLKLLSLGADGWVWNSSINSRKKSPGYRHNDQPEVRYMAYDQVDVTTKSAVSDKLVVGGKAVEDVTKGKNNYLWMGEDVDFYLDTTGAFGGDNCAVEIIPHYTLLTKKADGTPGSAVSAHFYTDISYSPTRGFTQHAVDLTKHSQHTDTSDHGHSAISYSLTKNLEMIPTVSELALTQELFCHTSTNTNDFTQTRTYDKILLDSNAKFIRDTSALFAKYSFLRDSVASDDNNDERDDDIQRSNVRWYGALSIPQETRVTKDDLNIGYCDHCDESRFVRGSGTKCNACNGTLKNIRRFFLDGSIDGIENENYLYDERITPYLETEGFVKITLDVKVTDCLGNETVIKDIDIVAQDGTPFELIYELGTKASGKWKITY